MKKQTGASDWGRGQGRKALAGLALGMALGMALLLGLAHPATAQHGFTSPALLNSNGAGDSGNDIDLRITTDGVGNWVAVWRSHENLNGTAGTDGDIFVATSADDGGTWTGPALLNTNGTSDSGSDYDPQVTTDGGGNWVAVWNSTENLNGTAGT
ncbi:MAG TPA: exo-alpha-sialidase, partial [Myxococcales bacterium]|nr:exo-alpha-sialidase [Myxococcales bacterium]